MKFRLFLTPKTHRREDTRHAPSLSQRKKKRTFVRKRLFWGRCWMIFGRYALRKSAWGIYRPGSVYRSCGFTVNDIHYTTTSASWRLRYHFCKGHSTCHVLTCKHMYMYSCQNSFCKLASRFMPPVLPGW